MKADWSLEIHSVSEVKPVRYILQFFYLSFINHRLGENFSYLFRPGIRLRIKLGFFGLYPDGRHSTQDPGFKGAESCKFPFSQASFRRCTVQFFLKRINCVAGKIYLIVGVEFIERFAQGFKSGPGIIDVTLIQKISGLLRLKVQTFYLCTPVAVLQVTLGRRLGGFRMELLYFRDKRGLELLCRISGFSRIKKENYLAVTGG